MSLPRDYAERVYAGVLGKIIGVYLGRPFEGWSYERILAELGEVNYYVHEKLGRPLVVTDDDISGTFTFLRALPDNGNSPDLTAAQIGRAWLNYLIEERTILWWGGMGNSTEHTAFLRLKNGVEAPRSGSIALNGKVVAEQIGAQIFVDGWAMVAPGDPDLAVALAERAGSVSHDGEALNGARVLAAMESLAFVQSDRDALLDAGVSYIPKDSVIYRLIADIREWHASEPDWQKTRAEIAANYGYDTYGGNCHIVPNHALIILGLLYGDDDFQKSLMIANTSGWDTDCNSGNLGCLLGIKNGLAGLDDGPDWRGPVADRMYLSTAEGGRGITDALTEAYHVVNVGRALAGSAPVHPKNGARFHFNQPGAVQGFRPEDSPEVRGTVAVANVPGEGARGSRSLALRYHKVAPGRSARVSTPTFIAPEALNLAGYALFACPTLSPGQTVSAELTADPGDLEPITAGLYLRVYGHDDKLALVRGPQVTLAPGERAPLSWQIPAQPGPIAEVGVELSSAQSASGIVSLEYLTWEGTPDVTLGKTGGSAARRAWVDAVDQNSPHDDEAFRPIQNAGRGMLIHGSRDWQDYRVSADVTPHLSQAAGLAARVQGLRRYYALLLVPGALRLIKMRDDERTLAEVPFDWSFGERHELALAVVKNHIRASVDGNVVFAVEDDDRPLRDGGVALVVEEGRTATRAVRIQPVEEG